MRSFNRLTVAVFLLLLSVVSAAYWLLPDKDFSDTENRSLRTLPKLSLASFLSGDYAAQLDEYFADQFPCREPFVTLKAEAELSCGKGENGGILIGSNGQLAKCLFEMRMSDGTTLSDTDRHDPEHLRASAEGINRVAEALEVPFAAWITGRTLDVTISDFLYPTSQSDALIRDFRGAINEGVNCPDLVTRFRALHRSGERVYYRTDHHWTTRGAYLAYRDLLSSWGMEEELIAEDFFEKTEIPGFLGTFHAAAGWSGIHSETLELWRGEDEDAYTVVADGRLLTEGFYTTRYLAEKDKYAAFLDGTHDLVTVTRKDAAPRPHLLIIKDSFANAMIPFLARHFDLTVLNLSSARKDYTNVTALAEEYHADRVLLVYTLGNVIATDRLSRLH